MSADGALSSPFVVGWVAPPQRNDEWSRAVTPPTQLPGLLPEPRSRPEPKYYSAPPPPGAPRTEPPLLPPEPEPERKPKPKPLVVIVGPTASGKSTLAMAIAALAGGEILSCDSVQIYRGFDIGSGKVMPEAQRGIRHHLLDIADPACTFTAGDYRREALRVLRSLRSSAEGPAKLPIVVGGTGLYLRALLLGLFEGPPRDEALRDRVRQLAARRGRAFLHRLLARLDPATAARIHPRDTQKIGRALEVCLVARQPLSALLAQGRAGLTGFQPLKIGLNPDRASLYRRINQRIERMYANGLVEETRAILARPDASKIKGLGALGYRQAGVAARGEISLTEAMVETQSATRHYAKRQLTWFRREPDITWLAGFGDEPQIQRLALDWLTEQRARLEAPGRGTISL